MRVRGIHHVAIVVEEMAAAVDAYSRALGGEPEKVVDIPESCIRMAIFRVGDSLVELIQPLGDDQTYKFSTFLAEHGESIHHLAVDVDDIDESAAQLRGQNIPLLFEEPAEGADGRIMFLHPSAMNGVFVELVERAAPSARG